MSKSTKTAQRAISYDDYLKLTGLFLLIHENVKQISRMEKAAAKIVGEPTSGHDYYGLISDAVFETDQSVDTLLEKMGIEVV